MTAPQWLRSTGAAAAIALSSLPLLAIAPTVVDAHRSLDRGAQREALSTTDGLTAAVTTVPRHGQPSANE